MTIYILGIDTSAGADVAVVAVGSTDVKGASQQVLARAESANPRAHTELLSPLIQQVLRSAGITPGDLDRIVVGTGPAPYTGLRVGLVTARTIADALGIPCHGVSSLDAIAAQHAAVQESTVPDRAAEDQRTGDSPTEQGNRSAGAADSTPTPSATPSLLVVTDARRREVYYAHYVPRPDDAPAGTGTDWVRIDGPGVDTPQAVAARFDLPFEATADGEVLPRGSAAALPVLIGSGTVLYPEYLRGVAAGVRAEYLVEVALGRSEVELSVEPLYLRRPDIHRSPAPKRASR